MGPAVLAQRLYVKLSLNGSCIVYAAKKISRHKSFPGVVYKYKRPEAHLGENLDIPLIGSRA